MVQIEYQAKMQEKTVMDKNIMFLYPILMMTYIYRKW